MGPYQLQQPLWLLAWLLIPLVGWLRSRRRVPVWVVPFAGAWHRPSPVNDSRWPIAVGILGTLLLIFALARPQRIDDRHTVTSQGYDLMLAIDLSTSMLSEDYVRDGQRINRLAAIQPVIQAFIDNRPSDRIGLVVFSGNAYTLSPLTLDHKWLDKQIERLKIGLLEGGTAVGDGLGVALSRLDQDSKANKDHSKGAFVILLTDGVSDHGTLTPEQATAIAKSQHTPVYTIGAGRNGYVPYPVFDDKGNRIGTGRANFGIDENTLRYMAAETGGRYFKADDSDTVEKAFKAIDQAEKIEFQSKSHLITTELFQWAAIPGASLLLLSALGLVTQKIRSSV